MRAQPFFTGRYGKITRTDEDASNASPALLPHPESPGVRLMPHSKSLRATRKLSLQTEGQILNRYYAGESASDLAREFGVGKNYVFKLRDRRALTARKRPGQERRLTPEQEDQFLERYFAGEVIRVLASEFGVSHIYYDQLLSRRGLSRRPPVDRSTPKPPKKSKSELFWERVDVRDDPDACWEWQRYCDPNGYGRTRFQGKEDYAHRVAWMTTNGVTEIPTGTEIRHGCDNPPCCNPNHLIPGTHLDNMRDREERGRGKGAENLRRHAPPKNFTDEQESRIVHLYQGGTAGQDISEEYGVTPGAIYRVLRRHGVTIRRRGRQSAQACCRSAVAQ